MATIDGLCVLVQIGSSIYPRDNFTDVTFTLEHVDRLIRSYESRERAEEDMELLRECSPERTFRILNTPHIER